MNEHSAVVWTACVAAIATITTGIIAFFGGKNSASAQVQAQINEGFASLNRANSEEIQQLRGELHGMQQYVYSLENALRAQGLELPKRPAPAAVVFAPFPKGEL